MKILLIARFLIEHSISKIKDMRFSSLFFNTMAQKAT